MNSFEWTIWLFESAWELLAFLWFVTLPLSILLIFSLLAIKKGQFKPPQFKYIYLLAFLISIVIVITGSFFHKTESEFANALITALWIMELALYVIEITLSKGYRMFAISLGGLLVLFASGATAVAGMSIYDSWL